MLAAREGHADVARLLLRRGADVEARRDVRLLEARASGHCCSARALFSNSRRALAL